LLDAVPLLTLPTWEIVRPAHALTEAHVAIRALTPLDPARMSLPQAAELARAYRATRNALHTVLGCDGFALSFSWSWTPFGDGIGEPAPGWEGAVLHVFGRGPGERLKPVRAMALPTRERPTPLPAGEESRLAKRLDSVLATIETSAPFTPTIRSADPAECDGCLPEVERDQELWRAQGVRVLRPRDPLVEANVLVLPLRHVASVGSLRPDEIVSYAARLHEVRVDFGRRFRATGLSCFVNDGARAGQTTPHAHVHVVGRSREEPANPFEILGRRIGIRAQG
jgi:diadenosine tetraphosphate (Ap4A) HIT family hydrolase